VLAAAIAIGVPAPAQAVNTSATFDANAENWSTSKLDAVPQTPGDPFSQYTLTHRTALSAAPHSQTGGNPSGRITYTSSENPSDDFPPSYVLGTFVAPGSWSGDISANYGGLLTFDFRTSLDTGDQELDVELDFVSGSTRFRTALPPTPGQGWTRYGTPLLASLFQKCAPQCAPGPAPLADFQAMLANPSKTIRIYATYGGPAGEDGSLDNPSLTEDDTAPPTELVSGPEGPTTDSTPTFEFDSPGGDFTSYGDSNQFGRFHCVLDDLSTPGAGTFEVCGTPRPIGTNGTYEATEQLPDGDYRFTVYAEDFAGNADPTPEHRDFSVDTAAPEVEYTHKPSRRVKTRRAKARVRFAFGAAGGADFECRLDAKPPAPCGSPKTYRVGRGKHRFVLTATDAAGNESSAVTSFKVIRKR
jgi:hypothetical protein